jgi:hypothetical protein
VDFCFGRRIVRRLVAQFGQSRGGTGVAWVHCRTGCRRRRTASVGSAPRSSDELQLRGNQAKPIFMQLTAVAT